MSSGEFKNGRLRVVRSPCTSGKPEYTKSLARAVRAHAEQYVHARPSALLARDRPARQGALSGTRPTKRQLGALYDSPHDMSFILRARSRMRIGTQPRAGELTTAACMFSRVGMPPLEVMPQQHREKARVHPAVHLLASHGVHLFFGNAQAVASNLAYRRRSTQAFLEVRNV